MAELQCPRCGNNASELQSIDAGLMAKLKESGSVEAFPPQVCPNCFHQLAGSVARGSVLMMREKAREQKKVMLWKSRVNLIKKARNCMTEKAFSEAAVAYEKYIRVLEVVFDVKPGALTPELFKESARTQELTVVASVYWDLLRIYDTSPKYGDRQANAANKLSLFLRFTPIYPDILRKAEAFVRSAKNPAIIKQFLKATSDGKGRCFIATAAFEYHSPEVEFLCHFRDNVLAKTAVGQAFINFYYKTSPPIAEILDKSQALKSIVRVALRQVVRFLK